MVYMYLVMVLHWLQGLQGEC